MLGKVDTAAKGTQASGLTVLLAHGCVFVCVRVRVCVD